MSDTDDEVVLTDPDVATVRSRVAAWTPAADTRDLQLAVTEVVANAHRHGLPPVEVTLRTVEGELQVRVRDAGPGPAALGAPPGPPPGEAEGGRGRWLASQLAVVQERRTPRGYEVELTGRASPQVSGDGRMGSRG